MSDVSNRDITVLLIVLEVRVDEDGDHRLCLLVIANPSSLCSSIGCIRMSGGPFNDGPPSCHSEQGANLARPLRIVLDAGKNGGTGLNGGVDVERHFRR
jgi:hypothetical protein